MAEVKAALDKYGVDSAIVAIGLKNGDGNLEISDAIFGPAAITLALLQEVIARVEAEFHP